MNCFVAGFDVGATKVALVIGDEAGRITTRLKEETDIASDHFAPYKDGLAYLGLSDQLKRLLHQGIKEAGIAKVAAIGIGSAGPLKDGDIRGSTNIKLAEIPKQAADKPLYIPLIGPLKEEFHLPMELENDGATAVLGEVYYGAGKDVEDKSNLHLVYITLSTGLGGGVWDGGRLLRGKQGNAAEVGHFLVRAEGLKCGCGNYGCAEAYCSGTGIVKNARMRLINEHLKPQQGYGGEILGLARERAIGSGSPEPFGFELLEFVTAPLIFEAAEAGDRLAQQVIEEARYFGGIVLADIANAYDPQLITIGGALALEHPGILEPIREEMLKHLAVEPPEVLFTPLGYNVVEYGALVLGQWALQNDG